MKEARWLLLVLGVIHVIVGLMTSSASTTIEASDEALGAVGMGVFYFLAGLVPSFWLRFVSIALWVADLLYTNLAIQPRPTGPVFITIGAIFLYKMWKYRAAHEPDAADSDKATIQVASH